MSASDRPVREMIPIERLSASAIRRAIDSDPGLGQWSRAVRGAIRPATLATLLRNGIWNELDVTFAEVDSRLGSGKPGASVCFRLIFEVEVGPGQACLPVEAVATFIRCGSGRIAAEAALLAAGVRIPLTTSRVLLAA